VVWNWLCFAVVFVLCFEPGVSGSVCVGWMSTFLSVGAAAGFYSVVLMLDFGSG